MTTVASAAADAPDHREGMTYLDRLPRRVVTIYLPLALFVFVLLFPFYWMGVTALKPNNELTNFRDFNPFWPSSPTLQHIWYLLFQTSYPGWLSTRCGSRSARPCCR
jgi:multiple sugar transport system permease protein